MASKHKLFKGKGCQEFIEKRFPDHEILQENLSTPVMFTTLRVNTLRIAPQEAVAVVKRDLDRKYPDRFKARLHQVIPDLIIIENHGPHSREQCRKVAVVDSFCGMAVMRGADIFVQGVLTMSMDVSREDLVSVYTDIEGTCLRGSKPNVTNMYYLGNGISKYGRTEIFTTEGHQLRGIGIQMTEPIYSCPSLNNLLPDLIYPQNLPSTLTVHILNPQPGETILDMCAAPGGKSGHIAELMNNSGCLVALDKTAKKIEKLRHTLQDWGVTNCHVYHYDGTKAVDVIADLPSFNTEPPFPSQSFDRILLDAPCSALGQRPCLANRLSAKELESYPNIQRKLLIAASKLLKAGGVLVYSTCTFMPDENENQVARFLKENPDFKLTDQGRFNLAPPLPYQNTDPLPEEEMRLLQRFNPAHQSTNQTAESDTIGFFIAKMVKKT